MTEREKFINAMELRKPVGRVPHFEMVFYLTMEAFGRVHPTHRIFTQWKQMSQSEQLLHRKDIADLYIKTAKKYEHSAIFVHGMGGWDEQTDDEIMRLLYEIRNETGSEYFLMIHGDPTFAIPNGEQMMEFFCRIADEPGKIKQQAKQQVEAAIRRAQRYKQHGLLDGFALCSDYCYNNAPFLSPAMFDEFITPYLTQTIAAYRQLGLYTIKHTDGNIMPILDSLIEANPHALHSLDPQGGVDIAELKQLLGGKMCLIGNVNCGLLDTGTAQEVVESARYALRHGMPDGGYIFSTSNCVYTGMKLERYELMLDVWRKEGNY